MIHYIPVESARVYIQNIRVSNPIKVMIEFDS